MALDASTAKKILQDHLQEGLLLVVGTGLSIAEDIPGMGALATHLKAAIPPLLAKNPDPGWDSIVAALDAGLHLEAAMSNATLQPSTVDLIVQATAVFILDAEQRVFEKVLAGTRELPLTRFFTHLFKAGKRFHLITPNYDRLVELAAEAAGIGLDTRFVGSLYGRAEPKLSADAQRETYPSGKLIAMRPLPHLSVYKPHGSLDWFERDGKVVRCPIRTGRTPIIITPGASKYRESFRWAFDDQRTAGNKAVGKASRLMFLGYGFNDDHLEQHICPGHRLGRPAVILARTLTENAQKVILNSANVQVIALSAVSETDRRTRISTSSGDDIVVDEELWHLEGFNQGVI